MTKALAEFSCDAMQWHRFRTECVRRGEDPAALLADFVRLKLKNWGKAAKRELATDEQLLVRLRLLVAEALSLASDWTTMSFELDRRGLAYHPSGGGLILIDATTGEILAKASQLGPSYPDLMHRFKSPHPALATAIRSGSAYHRTRASA